MPTTASEPQDASAAVPKRFDLPSGTTPLSQLPAHHPGVDGLAGAVPGPARNHKSKSVKTGAT